MNHSKKTTFSRAEREPTKFLFCLFFLFTHGPGLPKKKFQSIEPFLKSLKKGQIVKFQKGLITMPIEILREIQELLDANPTNYCLRSFIDRWEIGSMLNVPDQPPDPEIKKNPRKGESRKKVVLPSVNHTATSATSNNSSPASPSIKRRLGGTKPPERGSPPRKRRDFDVPHRNPQPANLLLSRNKDGGDINHPVRAIGEVDNFAPGCEPDPSEYISITESRRLQKRHKPPLPPKKIGLDAFKNGFPRGILVGPFSNFGKIAKPVPSRKNPTNGFPRGILVGPFNKHLPPPKISAWTPSNPELPSEILSALKKLNDSDNKKKIKKKLAELLPNFVVFVEQKSISFYEKGGEKNYSIDL